MSKLLIIATIFTIFIATGNTQNQEVASAGANIPNPIHQALSIICNAFQNSNSPFLQEINLNTFPEQMQTAIRSPLFSLMRGASSLQKFQDKILNPLTEKQK